MDLEKALDQTNRGLGKIRQAGGLNRVALACQENDPTRAYRLNRYAEYVRRSGYAMIVKGSQALKTA